MEHSKYSTKQLTLAALFIALTTVATMVVNIPIPGTHGFVNIGDSFVILSGLLFSHYFGGFTGGVGSAMADLFLGYAIYAPATLIIKGIEGFLAGIISQESYASVVIATIIAVIWMPIGYFLFETIVFGLPIALASLAFNYLQGVISGGIALILFPMVKRLVG